MVFKPTKNEMLLAVRRMSYASAASLPLCFKLGDEVIKGIPTSFNPTETKRFIDSNIVETVITGQRNGLEIRAEVLQYRDMPVVEYTVYFTNKGEADTAILSDINAIDADFCGEAPVLQYGNGEDGGNGYKFFEWELESTPYVLNPYDSGLSCQGAYPFFRVKFDDYILTGAIGWSGSWKAEFCANEMGINFKAGQKCTNFKILPGETMRTPRICLMLTESACETRAINMWRKFYNAHIMPKQWGENIPPKLCAHVFEYKSPEFTGATEDSQIFGLQKYLKRGIDIDLWWYDAGFYPCNGNWYTVGSWKEDSARWPNNGLGPLGKECEKNDIDLMVWFEPERVVQGTEIYNEHPEFLLKWKNEDGTYAGQDMFNYGNPEALNWMINRIDTLIKKWNIKCYRQDFNFNSWCYWRLNEDPDRLGAIENLCIQGYYKFWDELLLRNPGLFIDSCAGGGRRNDLETLRRSVSFQYTDVGLNDPAQKQRQHLMLFEWMPYFRAHTWSDSEKVDEYTWFVAWAPAVTFMPKCWAGEEEFEIGRKMTPIWRRAAELQLRGDYYRQMKIKYDEELTCFTCEHFYDPEKGDGFVMFLRNRDCEQESFTAKLAVEDEFDYFVENPLTGESFTKPAAELKEFTQSLEKKQGAVWFIQRLV